MTWSPCLIPLTDPSGEVRYELGHPLVDRYLRFVAGRTRPNTVRATAFDLKTFFTGFYAYVMARGDTALAANPVPRGLSTRRERGSKRSRMVPLVRVPRTLPKTLAPREVDALVGAVRTQRDRAMVLAMVLGGLRRCEMLGLRRADLWIGERRLFIAEGKGGHQRVVPIADRFFDAVGDYLHDERPPVSATDQVFVVLKGPRRGQPLSADGVDEILSGAHRRAGLETATCHQLRHTCLTRLREAGMALEAVQAQAGHRSIESTRIYLHLTNDWLAREYRRAADLIDIDQAAVNQLVAVQEAAAR